MSESKVPNLPKPLRKLFLIIVVMAPLYWMVLTEDGRQTTDLLLLDMFGKDSINIKIDNLGSHVTEELFLSQFPDVTFVCRDQQSEFGDHICQSSIGSFNDLPSQHLSVYFKQDHLQAMKAIYQVAYHTKAVEKLEIEIKHQSQPLDPVTDLMQWRTTGGVVVMNRAEPQRPEDAAIIWIAN